MTNQNKKRGPPPKGSRSTPQRTTPTFATPMAAQVVKRLPEGDDWVYELKFDGYRALVIKDGQRVELRSDVRLVGKASTKYRMAVASLDLS